MLLFFALSLSLYHVLRISTARGNRHLDGAGGGGGGYRDRPQANAETAAVHAQRGSCAIERMIIITVLSVFLAFSTSSLLYPPRCSCPPASFLVVDIVKKAHTDY